jgi:hypothetical protein
MLKKHVKCDTNIFENFNRLTYLIYFLTFDYETFKSIEARTLLALIFFQLKTLSVGPDILNALKGQCHEIFDRGIRLFCQISPLIFTFTSNYCKYM